MTTTNLLILAAVVASVAFAVWGNLAYRVGRACAERAAMQPETAAQAARALRDYHGSERPRFQLINTLLVIAASMLVLPMAQRGWDRPIPGRLAGVGLACLGMALVYLADFALRPLHVPTQPASLPAPSVEADR
jgi:hypothetical protein